MLPMGYIVTLDINMAVTRSQAKKSKRDTKIYIQNLTPAHFRIPAVCLTVDDSSGSRQSRWTKTPREKASRCVGRVRIGKNGKNLYQSVRTRVKNPHYKGTGDVTGSGYHLQARWRLVYDKRTGKAFDAKKHMSNYLRGKLS